MNRKTIAAEKPFYTPPKILSINLLVSQCIAASGWGDGSMPDGENDWNDPYGNL